MKRILIFLLMATMTVMGYAADTKDRVYVKMGTDPLVLNGDYTYFSVYLEGTQKYTAYQMDIHIPEGMSVLTMDGELMIMGAMDETEPSTFYPSKPKRNLNNKVTGYTYSHTVLSNMPEGYRNTIVVVCMSNKSENFLSESGELFRVYVKASPFMKPGDVKISIDNVCFTLNKINGNNTTISYEPTVECGGTIEGVSGDCTMNLNISSTTKWSTCVLPFDCELPEGVKAYTCTEKDDVKSALKLKAVASIEAFKPYILYSENGYNGEVSGTVDPAKHPNSTTVTDGLLHGAIGSEQITDGYVLQNLDSGVKFYNCAGQTFSIPAGKCWVELPSGASAKGLDFIIDDDATAIEVVEKAPDCDDTEYNIFGQRVVNAKANTIIIKNGKKYLRH